MGKSEAVLLGFLHGHRYTKSSDGRQDLTGSEGEGLSMRGILPCKRSQGVLVWANDGRQAMDEPEELHCD